MLYIYAQLEYSLLKVRYLWILLSYSNLKYIEKLQTIFSPKLSALLTRPWLAQIKPFS